MDFGRRYKLVRELGRGGMARVFLVEDAHLRQRVALKLFDELPASSAELEQIKREFALLCDLAHPRIARAYDFGYLRKCPYLTSEFISGRPLSEVPEFRDTTELIRTMAGIAEAVAFLHASKMLHLDIKPSNVILRASETAPDPVLIDFGLVRRELSASVSPKVKGSLLYMGPEYFRRKALGPWTDVYALGVTFYRMISGSYPRWSPLVGNAVERAGGLPTSFFEGEWDPTPAPPRSDQLRIPTDLTNVVMKCLSLNPRYRFPTAAELRASLERIQGRKRARKLQSGPVTQTVERERELATVDRFLDQLFSSEASARVLLVTGLSGMGQTQLFRELKVRTQTRGYPCYLETGYRGQVSAPGSLLRSLAIHLRRPRGEVSGAAGRWSDYLARLRRGHPGARTETLDGERRVRRTFELSRVVRSVRDPMVLAVDGVQFYDELSVELVTDLVRLLLSADVHSRPPIAVVLGCREEEAAAPLVRELSEQVLREKRAATITLGPLGLEDTLRLYRSRAGPSADDPRALAVYQQTGGCPARIVALAADSVAGPAAGADGADDPVSTSSRLSLEALSLLVTLQLLERPANISELARCSGLSRKHVGRYLSELKRGRFVFEDELGATRECWLPTPKAVEVVRAQGNSRARRAHRRIAEAVVKASSGRGDLALVEAVRHFSAAGLSRKVVEYGLPLARHFKSTFQNLSALRIYRTVYEALPRNHAQSRLDVALESAELHARTGELEEGIRLLREHLVRSRRRKGPADARLLLRLAVLYSRKGDGRRADSLFREGLGQRRRGASAPALGRDERLCFLNEFAALKTSMGEYTEAVRLCDEGLELARGSRSRQVREASLNLHATRANVALRHFEGERAIRDLGKALEAAEALGSLGNHAVILNNLGNVYSQCDRYHDALDAFKEAEEICLRIDEGPSLAAIYGNIAILSAKIGDYAEMENALEEAERLTGAIGRREEFLLAHARGLARLFQGRYRDARRHLEGAITAGEALADPHVVPFDELYRAEALLFEARYEEARRELRRLIEASPPRVRTMAFSRYALLAALTGQPQEVVEASDRYDALPTSPPIAFLDAWDALFLGWAHSITDRPERASHYLTSAEAYFDRHRLRPVAELVKLIEAENLLFSGSEPESVLESIATLELGGNALAVVFRALLEARLRMTGCTQTEERERCAGLLAEAGSALVGNPLPEWNARLEALRDILSSGSCTPPSAEAARVKLARALPPERRDAYTAARHWKAWTTGMDLPVAVPAVEHRVSPDTATDDDTSSTRTISLAADDRRIVRHGLVCRSVGMQRLAADLDRVRESELPVVIEGETGSGKELVARTLHGESRRARGPFLVVDCAAIPEALLAVELFGAKAGSYTDQTEDRKGILALAEGGAVLLDQISEVSLPTQAKLLRVLSEKVTRPVGEEVESAIDVRFLFATTEDLERAVFDGRFRKDLFHRIHVVVLRVPPLRERSDDVPDLARAFLQEGSGRGPDLEEEAIQKLRSFHWPGNVRQLKNVVSRLRLEKPERITAEDVDGVLGEPQASTYFPESVLLDDDLATLKDRLEREYILYHFRRLKGNTEALYGFLDLSRRQLYNRCKRLGIVLREERKRLNSRGGRTHR